MAKKFLTDINIAGGVYDSSGDIGNSGQVLSSTGSGVNWINATSSASVVYQDGFTGNGSTTAFTLANSIDNENKTQVYIDGVYQHKDNYSLNGTTLTFSTAPPNSSDIEVISFSSVSSADDILYDNDFASAGLMTTNGSGVYSITTNNSSNWNTAYTYSQVGHLPLAGGTLTGNLQLNDNVKARFGVGNDLDIYSDGTVGYIKGDDVRLVNAAGENIFRVNGDTAELYYNDIKKFETTSAGVTVAGDITMSKSASGGLYIKTTSNVEPFIALFRNNASNGIGVLRGIDGGHLYIDTGATGAAQSTKMVIQAGGNVGIGTTSPDAKLSLYHATDDVSINVNTGTGGSYPKKTGISFGATSTSLGGDSEFKGGAGIQAINTAASNNPTNLAFWTTSGGSPTERMRIDSSGGVGVNTTSITNYGSTYGNLDVSGSDGGYLTLIATNNTVKVDIAAETNAGYVGTKTGHPLIIRTDNVERLRIDANGKVGIGTTSLTEKLRVQGNSGSDLLVRFQPFTNNAQTKLYLSSVSSGDGGYFYDANNNQSGLFAYGDYTFYVGTSNISGSIGNPRMIIKQGGNVGIGTTSPGKLFSVVGADGRNSTTYLAEFVNNDNTSDQGHGVLIDGGNNANHHLFQVNAQNSAVFAVKGNGYVGIGITSPQTNLQVNGSPNGIVSHFGPGTNNGNGTWSAISLGYSEAGNAGYRKVGIATQTKGDGAARQDLHFLVDTASDSNSINISDSKMSIQYNTGDVIINNNLGIGTTSPTAKLTIDNGSSSGGTLLTSSSSSYTAHFIANTGTGSAGIYCDASNGDFVGSDYAFIGQTDDKWAEIRTYSSAEGIRFAPRDSVKMVINNSGNVGIGVTSPSATFQVGGGSANVLQKIWGSGTAGIQIFTNSPSAGSKIIALEQYFSNEGYLGLYYNGTEKVRFRSNDSSYINGGNVGIGDSSPSEKLEVNGNIKAADTTGKFFTNLYTVTTAATVDTFSHSGNGLWEYVIKINPNPGGSGSYADFYYGKLGIGTGWNGSNVTDYIWYQEDQTAPRDIYPSGGGNKTISFVMVSGGSEVTSVNSGTTITIRVKGFGGNQYNQNIEIYFRRLA